MFVLGLQGSPRESGNTALLLSVFMEEAEKLGASTQTLFVDRKNIKPCKELKTCETKGFCPINDDMNHEVYSLLWQADLIIMATPVFFYSVPAQLKSLIDRSQTQWARKYRLKLEDPGRKWRKGFVLALGATRGTNLFEGLNLTAKYFFDAVGAEFKGSLVYRKIENPGDITKHPSAFTEAKEKAQELIKPYQNRKKIFFVSKENACRSQMSQAFAQYYAGDKIEALSFGTSPAEKLNELTVRVMAEKRLDMAFRKTKSIQDYGNITPDIIITMGSDVSYPAIPGAEVIEWDMPDPAVKPVEFIRDLCDEIEKKVKSLITQLQ